MEDFDVERSYDILNSKDIEDDDFDELKEEFKEEFEIEITAAAKVYFELFTKGEVNGEEIDDSQETNATVVKIDGDWYLHPDYFGAF